MKQKSHFRHESLQDSQSVKRLLNALIRGISEERIILEDEDGTLELEAKGLSHLKVSATQDEDKNRVDLRLTWTVKQRKPDKKAIKIRSK